MNQILRNSFFMLNYIKKHCKEYIMITLAMSILSGVSSVISVLFIKIALNEVMANRSFKKLLLIVIIQFAFSITSAYFVSKSNNVVIPSATQRFQAAMQRELFEKAAEIELIKYDDPDFYNRYVMALNNSDTRAVSILNTYSSLISSVINCTGMFAIILYIRLPLILILVISNVVLSTYFSTISSKLSHEFNVSLIPIQRISSYVKRIFYLKNYAKELRMTRVSQVLYSIFSNTVQLSLKKINLYGTKGQKISFIQYLIQSLNTALLMIYLSYAYISELILPGDFAAVMSSANGLSNSLKNVFLAIPQLYEHSLYVDNFKEFLQYKSQYSPNQSEEITNFSGVHFRNCSFWYNDGNSILNDFTLSINRGEKIAIIGKNGSGKSTFIKLLSGLYKPQKGCLTYNDIDYTLLARNTFQDGFGLVFQDYEIYAISIMENILMRPVVDSITDTRIVKEALRKVGLLEKVNNLENGISTPLLKEFDSNAAVFSIGEYQKLAIARIFVKNYHLLILDEPFSHLDRKSEEEILKTLFEECRDTAMILVTHNQAHLGIFDKVFSLDTMNFL